MSESNEILSKEEVDECGSNGIDLSALAASHEALRAERDEVAEKWQNSLGEESLRRETLINRANDAETALHTLEADYGQMQEWYTAYRRQNPEGEVARLRAALTDISAEVDKARQQGIDMGLTDYLQELADAALRVGEITPKPRREPYAGDVALIKALAEVHRKRREREETTPEPERCLRCGSTDRAVRLQVVSEHYDEGIILCDDDAWHGEETSQPRFEADKTITFTSSENGMSVETRELKFLTPLPGWAPWSGDEHFIEWAQTCPLGEWIHYEGPRFSAEVYMTQRPAWHGGKQLDETGTELE